MGSLPANAAMHALAIDPERPERVYAAGGAGVFRSDDAGRTWESAAQGLPSGAVTALALDPREPQRLFATTVEGALYVSADGAETWQAAAGADAGAGQ